jgi:hypothetical protein
MPKQEPNVKTILQRAVGMIDIYRACMLPTLPLAHGILGGGAESMLQIR